MTRLAMQPDPARIARHRLLNAAQTLLVAGGLLVVLAIPAWVLAGGTGVVWVVFLGLAAAWLGGKMPSRFPPPSARCCSSRCPATANTPPTWRPSP